MKKEKVEDTTRGIVDILGVLGAVYKDIQEHPDEVKKTITDIVAQGNDIKHQLTTFFTSLQHIFGIAKDVSAYLEGNVSRGMNPDRQIQVRRISGALREQFPELSGTIVEHPPGQCPMDPA